MNNQASEAQEKRQDLRFSCAHAGEYLVDVDASENSGKLINLSRKGLAFKTFGHFCHKDSCQLGIHIPGAKDPVSCRANIIWVQSNSETGTCQCGGYITRMEPENKMDILDGLYQDWRKRAIEQLKQ
ncbi:MAG: PilZ domain-containing protein [Candidatus Omnitrophota bacterium]